MEQLDGVMSQYNLQPLVGLIDPRMLYGFTMLYQTRNYRVAAVQLHQSLTSLSRNIKALETLLGVKLFQRTTRQVVPTQLADELYERLQKPLHDLSDALLGAQEATEQVKGRVRLTTTSMIAEMMLPKVLQALSTQYPQVRRRRECQRDLSKPTNQTRHEDQPIVCADPQRDFNHRHDRPAGAVAACGGPARPGHVHGGRFREAVDLRE